MREQSYDPCTIPNTGEKSPRSERTTQLRTWKKVHENQRPADVFVYVQSGTQGRYERQGGARVECHFSVGSLGKYEIEALKHSNGEEIVKKRQKVVFSECWSGLGEIKF